MSGTSLDGVDVAMLTTDGVAVAEVGPTLFRPYSEPERAVLKAALGDARDLTDRTARPGALAEAEGIVTDAHADAIEHWLRKNADKSPDLIGFHGQTVFHAPHHRITIQLGDGAALARRIAVPVVYDFRAADVAAGGEGAPFVPVYHRALVDRAGLAGPVVVVNIGGVANITRIAADGSMLAGDTGPGNALIDDLVRARTGEAWDRDGAMSARGTVDEISLSALMADPWFDEPFPKSLDRNAFSPAPVNALSLEDGAATLAAFTGFTIAAGIIAAGGADTVVVTGGGAHNRTIMRFLREATAGARVLTASDLGWDGDFIEAQAFAFLAARSLARFPLSYPETTGVSRPMTGGILVQP
jgi:anhydro-N-acetylmuramic acid kinase